MLKYIKFLISPIKKLDENYLVNRDDFHDCIAIMIEVMQYILFVPGLCFGWAVTLAPLFWLSDKIDRIRYERMLKKDEEERLREMARYYG